MKIPALFLALSLLCGSLAHADTKAERQKFIDEQTAIINSNTAESYVLAALINRGDAYVGMSEFGKASADVERALGMLERHTNMVDYLPARFTLWKDKGQIAYFAMDYEQARKDFTEAANTKGWETFYDAVELLLYRSQTHLYLHSTVEARAEAEQAIKLCPTDSPKQLASAHENLSIALFEMGDMEGATTHWNEARKTLTYLGEAPFAPEQIPFNRAVHENRDTSKAASSLLERANYFLTAAQDLELERETTQEPIYFVRENTTPKVYWLAAARKSETQQGMARGKLRFVANDTTIYGLGGYSNLVVAKRANATPITLADDALLDLKIAEDYQYNPSDFFALRAKVRAYRWRLDDWDSSRKIDFRLSEVDKDYNKAVELKPFDTNVRRGRAYWLESRSKNLKRDAAGGAPMTPAEEAQTQIALATTIIEDVSRVLLKAPRDLTLLWRRIDFESKRPHPDLNALLVDYNTLIPLLSGSSQVKATASRDKIQTDLAATKPSTGTALEWKNKGNTLSAAKDLNGAIDAYTKALLIDPKFADAFSNRANSYSTRGEYDLAMRDFNEALALNPRHKAAYMGRSRNKLEVGDFDGAIADARKSLEVAPDEIWRKNSRDHLVATLWARAESHTDSKTPEAMLAMWTDYHEINTLAPTFDSFYAEGRAATYLRRGTEAITALNKALALKANDADALLFKTIVLTAQNSPQAAAAEKQMMAFINRVNDPYSQRYHLVREFVTGAAFNPNDAAEKARLTALQDRFWEAWRNS